MKITLDDGRWLEMRAMYVSDMIAIGQNDRELDEARENRTDGAIMEVFQRRADIIAAGCTARSWEGPLLQCTMEQLLIVPRLWEMATEDVTVPPMSAPRSEKPRPSRSSKDSRSRGRKSSSGKSSTPPETGASPHGG